MRWLIVEDSLENRKGHWFEYLSAFHRELPRLGDAVTWLVCQNAGTEVRSHFGALPVLPESAFRKMSDGAPAWHRYARIPVHAWKTFWAVRRQLNKPEPLPDIIFVPTVILHHLLGWYWLIKTTLRLRPVRVLLFFPGLPLCQQVSGAALDGSPSARLTRCLIRWLAPEIKSGKVILGVETEAMRLAATKVFGVPFTYFPHPVSVEAKAEIRTAETLKTEGQKAATEDQKTGERGEVSSVSVSKFQLSAVAGSSSIRPLTMACYGPARYEKGSDILAAAIEQYLNQFPDSQANFVLQWLGDFARLDGSRATLPPTLGAHPRVEIISRVFGEGECARRLAQTDVLLLPYRRSSYDLRVSRVVVEAMVQGIPVVVTRGTTLAGQAEQFGAAILCEEGDVASLIKAIQQVEQNYQVLKALTEQKIIMAQDHFSIGNFRKSICGKWKRCGMNDLPAKQPASRGRKKYNVVLQGWYGEENLGDDLLLLKILEKMPDDVNLTILGRVDGLLKLLPDQPQLKFEMRGRFFKRLKRVMFNHCIVLGGGGLFPLRKRSVVWYLDLILAVLLGKKIVILGIGINPHKFGIEKRVWSFLAKRAVYVSVRDKNSHAFLAECVKENAVIEFHQDLVFSGPIKLTTPRFGLFNQIEKPYALICPAWFPGIFESDPDNGVRLKRLSDEFVDAIKTLSQKGLRPIFVSFFPRDDRQIIQAINSTEGFGGIPVLEYQKDFSISDVAGIFEGADFCLCMRFHSIVLAAQARCNFAAICYDFKSTSLLESLGLKSAGINYGVGADICFLKNEDLKAGELSQLVKNSIEQQETVRKVLTARMPEIEHDACKHFAGLSKALS
jgi:polysaccharide pyruvyl transferase WcaK-like protein/glycosyltransferase involved in cell wall biosynthesis